jgi:acyl-CoA reductase-like NAD-dependent aldehyde dehydrogenase/nicotinamidase-related amidase
VKPALLLIDLQNDYLAAAGLQPAAPALVARAAALLEGFRAHALPVIHVQTTVSRTADRRMPHWRQVDKWCCVAGTPGHEPPAPLRPRPGETIVAKTFYSGFEDGSLDARLRSLGCGEVIIAGVHTHGCIRASVLDAYQRGYAVTVADDATGSDDALHEAITRRYLRDRAARWERVEAILAGLAPGECPSGCPLGGRLVHVSPRARGRVLWEVEVAGRQEVARAARAARQAAGPWRRSSPQARAEVLRRLADLLGEDAGPLARRIAEEVGKPVTQAAAEVHRTRDILYDIAGRSTEPLEVGSAADARYRYRPLGVLAVVSPWNNPLAIPVGKIAPALLYGNTVVWKPAPAGTGLALRLVELLDQAECPRGVVILATGDQRTAQLLAAEDEVDAVTLSGSIGAGYALQEACARRHVPFQAELGGNNAAIVWGDADLPDAAGRIAEAAFGFAGQRCTANRRAVVAADCYETFLGHLQAAVAGLVWGDPLEPATQVGPVISDEKRNEVAAVVGRAAPAARRVLVPHQGQANAEDLQREGAYYPPTIICVDDPALEIVQEETFGPVLVVQRAGDFSEALDLCNGVRQGLVAALFSRSAELQERFLDGARAGILKLNRGTADADARTPFGGWKASGVGPPEHGPADREFHTRTQAVYHRTDQAAAFIS